MDPDESSHDRAQRLRNVPTLLYDTPFDKHLRPGEQLRWVGRPRQGWRYRWTNRLLIVEIGMAVFSLIWLTKFANWCAFTAGFNLGLPLDRPSLRSSILVLLFASVLAWQLISERRRRAGTWYAVTDRRVLFVLTTVVPQSVIGVEFDQIAQISRNTFMEMFGPRDAILLKLKDIDPYMAGSRVLGYQMSARMIFLEDLENPREFYEQLRARGH